MRPTRSTRTRARFSAAGGLLVLLSATSPAAASPSGGDVSQRAWLDFDGDGDLDLYVANPHGPERLFRRDGEELVDVTWEVGLADGEILVSAWEDWDGDGDLDLFAVRADVSTLLRFEGGVFVDVTEEAGLVHAGRDLDAAWSDPNGDGRWDLEIAQHGRTLLFENLGGGAFSATELQVPVTSMHPVIHAVEDGAPVPGGSATSTASSRPSSGAPASFGSGADVVLTPTVSVPAAAAALNPVCAAGLDDQSGAGCIPASSSPQLGALLPLGTELFVAGSGEVGLGTTAPAGDLHVRGGTTTAILQGTSTGQDVRSELQLQHSDGAGFRLSNARNGGSSKLEIDSITGVFEDSHFTMLSGVGSVGLNVDVPLYRLHVYDELAAPQVAIDGGPAGAELLIAADDDNSNELHQARITMTQDGGQTVGRLGFLDGSNAFWMRNELGGASLRIGTDGGVRHHNDADGVPVFEWKNEVHGGAQLSVYDNDGVVMSSLDTDSAGGGGRLRLWDGANGNPLVVLEAQEGGTGANMRMRNDLGNTTFELDAEFPGDAGARMWLSDGQGASTIILNGESGRITGNVLQLNGGADIAEPFDVSGEDVRPGLLVSIDPARPGGLELSNGAYDRTLVGVISGANGIRPGVTLAQEGTIADGEHPVALSGRVWCWADAGTAAIAPGDLLTSSEVPGHAMRATDESRAFGAVVGKAMTGLEEGRGLVLVWVNLQ